MERKGGSVGVAMVQNSPEGEKKKTRAANIDCFQYRVVNTYIVPLSSNNAPPQPYMTTVLSTVQCISNTEVHKAEHFQMHL